jgi:sigma-B regulation protein RsbU (phosphoserine phosphatase)
MQPKMSAMDRSEKVRILHIEDDPSDAELIRYALLKSGFSCDIHLATSGRGCLAALENGVFDLVLSDSHGHDFTGLSLLHLVRGHLPHVPFIFLSGSFDDSDPETLKAAGATDCILKDDLDALIPLILQVLAIRK